jgi:hypothetical protein
MACADGKGYASASAAAICARTRRHSGQEFNVGCDQGAKFGSIGRGRKPFTKIPDPIWSTNSEGLGGVDNAGEGVGIGVGIGEETDANVGDGVCESPTPLLAPHATIINAATPAAVEIHLGDSLTRSLTKASTIQSCPTPPRGDFFRALCQGAEGHPQIITSIIMLSLQGFRMQLRLESASLMPADWVP